MPLRSEAGKSIIPIFTDLILVESSNFRVIKGSKLSAILVEKNQDYLE